MSRIFHPCNLVPQIHVSHFPPLQHGAAFSCLAFSTPAFLTVPYFHVSHFQSPLPYVRVSPDTSSFLAFVRAGFLKSAVCPGFWPNLQVHSNAANCKGVRRHETKNLKQATGGCSVLMCLQYCNVTTSNSVVNYQDIFSVKFCAQCEYSKTCEPICVICIWFCIVSVDPILVIFAYLQVCEKVSSYSIQTIW